jgi:hypothetical protein
MNSRYVAPKAFFALAAFCALVGTALLRRDANGSGLTAEDFLNPLFWVTIPRLIPFTASILSVCFGAVYLGLEKDFKRSPNTPLALVHLVSFVFAILGHAILVRFWWRVLGEEHANIPLPSWASLLAISASVICCFAFVANIFWSLSRAPLVTRNPR